MSTQVSPTPTMSTLAALEMLNGGVCDAIKTMQLNRPPWTERNGLNTRLLVMLPGDSDGAPITMSLPLETRPSGPNHSIMMGLVIPSGNSAVQVIP